jgi:hypothetical protein
MEGKTMKHRKISRRPALAAPLAIAAVSTFAFGVALAAPSTAATNTVTALPTVDMARVVAAAQVEPRCGDKAGLADNASTKLVQQALVAKGISTTADGWYGNGTTSAYATWQRRQGYSGIDANGLPGPSSLTLLGNNRFSVAHKVNVGSSTDTYGGKRVNTRTRQMLQAADNLLPNWNFSLTQGSYNPGGVGASAGTHDGGGVVDISVGGLTATQRWQQVKALRTVGFAAWLRTPEQGFSYHIHAVAISDTDIWQKDGGHVARDQVCDYYIGKNGLASHAADNTPTDYRMPFTWWERYKGL